MAYPIELKQKALAYLDKIGNISKVCVAYGISRNTLYEWIKKQKQGDLSCKSGGSRGIKLDRAQLKAFVEQNPDLYLHEIAQHFGCAKTTVFYALQSLNMSLKKRQAPTKSKAGKKSKTTKTL